MAMLPRLRVRREPGRHRREARPLRHPTLLGLLVVVALLVTGGATLANLTASPTATPIPLAAPTPTDVNQGRSEAQAAATGTPASPTPSASPSPSPEPDPEPTEPAPPPSASTTAPDPPRDTDRESRRRAPDPPTDQITALEDEVTALTNQERRAAGCGEVSTDERLRAAARGHSQDMADHDYFSHTGRDGSSFVDRARAAGHPSPAGENIAYGYATPTAVMNGWMNSDGHRRNLLNCSHQSIGVGLAYDSNGRPYWTQVFGR